MTPDLQAIAFVAQVIGVVDHPVGQDQVMVAEAADHLVDQDLVQPEIQGLVNQEIEDIQVLVLEEVMLEHTKIINFLFSFFKIYISSLYMNKTYKVSLFIS